MVENKEKKYNVRLKPETHKAIMRIKIDTGLKNADEVLKFLIKQIGEKP